MSSQSDSVLTALTAIGVQERRTARFSRSEPHVCRRVILLAMKLLLATTNRGKISELRRILGQQAIELVGLDDGDSTEEIETAKTFAENALLKARHYHRQTGLPTIADDSGL